MKARLVFSLAVALFACFLAQGARAESVMLFCESMDGVKPVNPGSEFTGPTICAVAASDEAFGKPEALISFYKLDGEQMKLIERQKVEINPQWNNLIMENVRVPAVGDYMLAINQSDGSEIASGKFKIVDIDSQRKVEPPRTRGATLKELFNKYTPKN